LQQNRDKNYRITLISEMEHSFYSGMLPGAVAKLYTDEELKVNLKTTAIWSEAQHIF
jgi:hypothetical protein